MRHLKAGKALGVTPSHRRAMLRNIVTSVLEHGRIKTTVTRAKELRKPLDHMIGLGKRGDLHARRQALAFVKSKAAMANLFGELAERYSDRDGGYSRIFKISRRRKGDGAELAVIEILGSELKKRAEDRRKRREERLKKQQEEEQKEAAPAEEESPPAASTSS